MIEKWTDLSGFFAENHISASAPTRLDCGGSTDHRLTGLLCNFWQPATTNIAIDLRANICLKPFTTGKVFVDIKGIGQNEFAVPNLPFKGNFALVSAIVCYFGVHGLKIEINTEFPFESGLGGSGAVAIALIGAIFTALNRNIPQPKHFPGLVRIAHNLEDSLFGNTGMQDQAAALYGGVNLWEWQYSDRIDFKGQKLKTNLAKLNEHILLAYTGRPHLQSQNGSQMLEKFKETADLPLFVSITEQARKFAECLENGQFNLAGETLTKEFQIRSKLLPNLGLDDLGLIEMVKETNCGVSVTGRGGGGCLWAIGEKQDIALLKKKWENAFESRKMGYLLPFKVTGTGLKISWQKIEKQ